MGFRLKQLTLGPWPMNGYILVCKETQTSAVIDPGADPEKIIQEAAGTSVAAILLTHGHSDHVGALEEIKQATGAPVHLHPADADHFSLAFDRELKHGDTVQIGEQSLTVHHTPGHTPGQVCFDLGDGRVLVGDTIFVNGPGRTQTPEDFAITMLTIQRTVLSWPDPTEFFPGHGPSGTIGSERPRIMAFIDQGWPEDLHGDVTWE